jgi:hypothetical protein
MLGWWAERRHGLSASQQGDGVEVGFRDAPCTSPCCPLVGAVHRGNQRKMPEGAVIRVDPKNTSRTCAACGHCAPGNRESQAVFECEACGHHAHADTNAAVVILDRALSTTAPGHGVSGRASPAVLAGSANQPAA